MTRSRRHLTVQQTICGSAPERIRVVQKEEASARGEEDFATLQPSKILFAASIKLEYVFYILAKRF